jgi:hypothetical protein
MLAGFEPNTFLGSRDGRMARGLLLAVLGVAHLSGCSSEPEVPVTPVADGGTTATAAPPPPPPPPPAPTTDPTAVGPCDAVTQLALQTAIQSREKAELGPGMKKEGTFRCEKVTEGGSTKVPVTLQPGRCYTFLAHSFPNVTEVNVFVKPNFGPQPPPLLAGFANMVFAQDAETGPTASIGKGTDCFKNPLPLPGAAVVDVVSQAGAGPVALQIYSKGK